LPTVSSPGTFRRFP